MAFRRMLDLSEKRVTARNQEALAKIKADNDERMEEIESESNRRIHEAKTQALSARGEAQEAAARADSLRSLTEAVQRLAEQTIKDRQGITEERANLDRQRAELIQAFNANTGQQQANTAALKDLKVGLDSNDDRMVLYVATIERENKATRDQLKESSDAIDMVNSKLTIVTETLERFPSEVKAAIGIELSNIRSVIEHMKDEFDRIKAAQIPPPVPEDGATS